VSWRAWGALAVLSAVSFLAYMDRMALSILMEPIKQDLSLSDQQLGLLSGLAFALFYSTFGLPVARLADRTSRVKLLAVCVALWTVATALSGKATSFLGLFAARVGVGIGEAGCVPAAHSLISDLFSRSRRVLAITLFQLGGAMGLSLGVLVIGLLGESYGWRTSLIAIGLAGIPVSAALLFLREPPRPAAAGPADEKAGVALSALLRRAAFVHLVLAYGLSTISSTGITQWVPAFLMRSFDMSMGEVGIWYGLTTAMSILGLPVGGVLSMWLSKRDARWELWFPALTYGLALPLYLAMFLSPTAWWALSLKLVANFLTSMGGGVALAAVQSFAEPRRRATAVSIMLFVSSMLGMGLGPFLIGTLSDILEPTLGRESLRYALLVSCLALAWAVVHFLWAASRSNRDRVS
jgi:predicted MFS family arabinose efflux permease